MYEVINQICPALPAARTANLIIDSEEFTYNWVINFHKKISKKNHLANAIEIRKYSGISVSGENSIIFYNGEFFEDESINPQFVINWARENPLKLNFNKKFKQIEHKNPIIVYQNWGIDVYGHFLIFQMQRLLYIKKYLSEYLNYEILISIYTPKWHLNILEEILGFDREKFVYFDPSNEIFNCSEAIIPTLWIGSSGFHPFGYDTTRKVLQCNSKNLFPKKIFIRRRNLSNPMSIQRKFTNESEIEAICNQDLGTTAIDPSTYSFEDQYNMFSGAELIIGEYGSGLHNSIFSPATAKVISIGHINLLQSDICGLCGQDIAYFSVKTSGEFHVDPVKFKTFISRVRDAIDEKN